MLANGVLLKNLRQIEILRKAHFIFSSNVQRHIAFRFKSVSIRGSI
jgi:hypothetical protein